VRTELFGWAPRPIQMLVVDITQSTPNSWSSADYSLPAGAPATQPLQGLNTTPGQTSRAQELRIIRSPTSPESDPPIALP
jgi:hypothetical protein